MGFTWTENAEKAAILCGQEQFTYKEIAARLDIDPKTLYLWRQDPEFKARVQAEIDEFRSEVRRIGLASAERRIAALKYRWNLLNRVINARADDPKLADVPGGDTGLIVHNVKGIGKGADFQRVDLYAVDAAILKELRDLEKQIAIELGQWEVKTETNTVSIRDAVAASQAAAEAYTDPDDDEDDEETGDDE